MKRSLLLKTSSSRRQLHKLKNLSKKKNEYQKVSFQKDGILYYKGRTLATERLNATCEIPSVMKDLSSSTFCVPAIYKHPPLAYSMVNKIHWHSDAAKHSCVESVLRYVLKLGYIMQGRDLVKKVKKNCKRWRYLRKKAINIEIGPVSSLN